MTVAPSKHVSVVESLSQVILGLGCAARWPRTGTHSGESCKWLPFRALASSAPVGGSLVEER
jgi:hypothetical protein